MKKSLFYKILLIAAGALAAGYLLFACVAFACRKENGTCNRLSLVFADDNEVRLIKEGEVEQYLKKNGLYPVGKVLSEIKTEQIENGLDRSEMIKSAECYFTPSGTVYIRIKQRTPKFRVIGDVNYYVDVDRHRLPVSLNYTAYLPVVTGNVTAEMAAGELFDFVSYIEDNEFWNAQIEQIHVRPDKKVELVPRVGESIILLGTLDDYEAKFDKLRRLYVQGFNKIGWNRYKTIDLQYKGQVVCTKK